MLAPSVLQPRKSEVKHGVRHREQPRKQEARGNTQTATPPQAQARPRQSPGNAEPPTRARAPACARARQRAPGPQRMPGPQHARARQRMPEPPTHARAPARAGTKTWWVRCRPCSGEPSPQRTPGRKPGSGALIEPTIGLRDANRATRRVPRALAGPSSESPRRRIVNFVRPWSKQAIICAIGKPMRAQPTKTSISHFRDREKPSVLTANDQNQRFFASRALHDSPFPCPTSSTPVIDLGDGRLLRQA